MANEEQLSILKQGVKVWNRWREENPDVLVDLRGAYLLDVDLGGADLSKSDLNRAVLNGVRFVKTQLSSTNLASADLNGAIFNEVDLTRADLSGAQLRKADFNRAYLYLSILRRANLTGSNFSRSFLGETVFANLDLSEVIGLENAIHLAPSTIGIDTFNLSKNQIPAAFLKGCGLGDWEIEQAKLFNPDLSNEEIIQIQYKIYELRATQALQISPLFISYSQKDGAFIDKIEKHLNNKGLRFWRDIHEMKAGRIEKQINRAIRQNPTVLLVLSKHSLSSDWVEHEVRTARELEKDMNRDVLCPIALDDSWKSSHWPKRIMEQIMEYNILDFSEWQDDVKFDGMFRKLIDGLELFYKK